LTVEILCVHPLCSLWLNGFGLILNLNLNLLSLHNDQNAQYHIVIPAFSSCTVLPVLDIAFPPSGMQACANVFTIHAWCA